MANRKSFAAMNCTLMGMQSSCILCCAMCQYDTLSG